MVHFLKYFCSIIAVICAVSYANDEDECSIGRVYNTDAQSHISNIPTGWYLNLDNPLSCSGRLRNLMVRFYRPITSGYYCLPWALWKPLENGTYQRVPNSNGSYCPYFEEADDEEPELYTHGNTIQSSQRHLVEEGLIIGVYIKGYNTLSAVTDSSRIFESSGVCQATSGVTETSSVINCTVYGSGRLNLLLNVDIIDCGQPSPPANGSVTYGSTQYGSVITYACYSGYTLIGSLNNTCSSAGNWTAPTPTCQQLEYCPNITINNGSMRANNSMDRGPFHTGTTVLFTCDVGFRLSGSPRLVCRPDATWDSNPPTCVPNETVIPPSVTGFNSSNTIIMSSTVESSSTSMATVSPSVTRLNSSNTIIISSTVESSSTSMATVFTTLLFSASRASVSSSSSFMATSNNVISQNTVSVSVSPSNSVIPIINEPIFTRTQLIILIVACGLFTSAITAIIALVILIMCKTRRKEGRNISSTVSYFVEGSREDLIYSDIYREPQQSIAVEERQHHQYEEPQLAITRYEEPARGKEDLYVQLDRIKVKKILLSDIELKDYLGSGQFGFVHKGIWKGSLVAVKSLRNETTDIDRVKFLQEAAIMGQFSHSNIVKLYGLVNEGDDNIMLVVELMPAGDLQKYLLNLRNNQSKEGLAENLLTYCREICSGMLYLSKRGFVHRDLAARNILLTATNQCKIADFGMSRDVELEGYYVAQRGTMIPIKWTAPEALKYRKYSSASDVWSYGCVLYEIWSLGLKPFEQSHNKEVLDKLDKGYRMPPPSGCPYLMYKLMILCWHPEPSQRPSFAEISRFLLEQTNESLLNLPESDIGTHPKAKQLGSSDLYAGEKMYKDLQNAYVYYSTLQHI